MSDALQRLIDAVERGNWDGSWRGVLDADKMMPPQAFSDAYHGSLDAAKAVHDALLPDWFVAEMTELPRRRSWVVRLAPRNNTDPGFRSEPVIHRTQEGAWLLAIFRAYHQVQA